MNRIRRNELKKGVKFLEEAIDSTMFVKEDEYYSLGSLEERFENNPHCEKMSENIDNLEDAIDQMMDAKELLNGVLSR